MELHHVHLGEGQPLLLVHGLGSRWQTWDPILQGLTAQREVIAVDLPGFGQTPPLNGPVTIATLTEAVAGFIDDHELLGVDLVGSSMGARLVLELARRGVGGTAVALDPGGFWSPAELQFFRITLGLSIRLVRLLQPVMPLLAANAVTRTVLLAQLSARPWAVDADLALQELRSFAQSPSFDAVQHDLVYGAPQQGAPAGSTPGRVVIGWGRKDRLTLPRQAQRATELFPDARLEWFDSGHFPHWDCPQATVKVILAATG
ncbi:alpha/beta fold hydrolase [soil metagenome]